VVPLSQVVCVTAFGQPGRGFESAVMPKVKFFMAIFRVRSFLLAFLHSYRVFTVKILTTHANGEDPLVLSFLSLISPSSSEELWFIYPAIRLLLLCSVVHCLTLISLLAGQLWTLFLWIFFLMARHVTRLGYMCLSVG
jgi:hypothetical protein